MLDATVHAPGSAAAAGGDRSTLCKLLAIRKCWSFAFDVPYWPRACTNIGTVAGSTGCPSSTRNACATRWAQQLLSLQPNKTNAQCAPGAQLAYSPRCTKQ
eukprot:1133671-Pelagomonas_calceolata.AAC.11